MLYGNTYLPQLPAKQLKCLLFNTNILQHIIMLSMEWIRIKNKKIKLHLASFLFIAK